MDLDFFFSNKAELGKDGYCCYYRKEREMANGRKGVVRYDVG